MGRRGSVTAGERGALGLAIVTLVGAFWWSGEQRTAVTFALVVLLPYLAWYAPFRCGALATADSTPCRRRAAGLLLGCDRHRLDRLHRVWFGPPRVGVASQGTRPPDDAGPAGAEPPTETALLLTGPPPTCTRSRARDRVLLTLTVAGMVVGWGMLLF
jgi:hypothetical protein